MKRCSRCKEEKPLEEFYRDKRTKDGKYSDCKKCRAELRKKYCNRIKHREYNRQYRKRHKEEMKAYSREYYKTHKEQKYETTKRHQKRKLANWAIWLKKEYGDSPICQICGKSLIYWNGKESSVNWDHRHNGDEVISAPPNAWMRGHACNKKNQEIFKSCDFGILCSRCNSMLPTKDRKEFLQAALKYMEDDNDDCEET